MSTQTEQQEQGAEQAGVLIRSDGDAYAVPVAVLDQYRVAPERRAQVESELRAAGGPTSAAEAALFELPPEALAPYRLSDEVRAELEAQAIEWDGDDTGGFCTLKGYPHGAYPINPYTGYDRCTFFDLTRTSRGTVGVLPTYRAPLSGKPTDTIR